MSKSSSRVSLVLGFLALLAGARPVAAAPASPAAGPGHPWAHLQPAGSLAMTGTGTVGRIRAGGARPTALAAADFDEDGVPDLVAGFVDGPGGVVALLRGNVDSIHPHAPEAKVRREAGRFVDAPFLPEVRTVAVPLAPEFVGAGDFDADGHFDLVLAARGEATLCVLPGDGRGGFAPATRVALAGPVTALAVGEVNRRDGLADIVVGWSGPRGAGLSVFEGPDGAARSTAEEVALPAAAAALALGEFDGARGVDLAVAAGRSLVLVSGRDRRLSLDDEERAAVAAAVATTIALPSDAVALVAGDFVADGERRDDLAALGRDGVVRLLAAGDAGLVPRGDAISIPFAGAGRSRLARSRTSALPGDDLLVVDPSGGAIRLLRTADGGDARRPVDPVTFDVGGSPVDLLPISLGVDSLDDLVVLKEGADPLAVAITAPLATFVVNSTNDVDDGACGAHCSLREAINAANALGGVDQISFAIGTGARTIAPTSPLPVVADPLTIDGTTQPGFAGSPLIEINGQGAGTSAGLETNSGATTIKGLVVNRFSLGGIRLRGLNHLVSGCYIGIDLGGTVDLGNGLAGIRVYDGYSTVGGTTAAARNVISGNSSGIDVAGTATTIVGNYIGTNAAGTWALGNSVEGVVIDNTAGLGATIGSAAAGGGNVISGNNEGVTSYGSEFIAMGNLVGTNAAGTASLGNLWAGFQTYGAFTAQIGGTGAGAGNVVSGNQAGIYVSNGSSALLVQGNRVGTNAAGTVALPNSQSGVEVDSSPGFVLGGTAAGARNVISGNTLVGVSVVDSDGVKIQGNFVGVSASGSDAVGNQTSGIRITGTSASCRIGGLASARNVVSGNGGAGIEIDGSGGGHIVQGNVVGADPTRTISLGNGTSGLLVTNGSWNVIGGSLGGANWFWWNGATGLTIAPPSLGNTISMNSFRDNGGLALDLGGDGITANDPLDADAGANGLPNTPVLDAVVVDAGTVVAGHYHGAPMAAVTLEFFASSECDYLGRGEGTTYLGSAVVSTNGEGDASFVTTLATLVAPGNVVTATATDADGQTSEFSGCRAVTGPQLVFGATSLADGTGNGNGVFDLSECVQLSVTLRNIGSSAATNVRATLAANSPGVVVGQPSGTWANLAGGASGANVIPFTVSAASPVACGATVDLVLTVTATEGAWVVPFSLVVGRVRHSATGPVAIPDNTPAGVDLPLVVPATAGTITNVVASLHVAHSYDADLVLSLRHPDGTEVLLADRRGGGGDHFGTDCPAGSNDTVFDGSALASIVGGAAPFVGTWRPEGNLAAFVGKPATGTWRLRAVDVAPSDTGSIQCWTLSFATGSTCAAAPGPCSAPAGEPNPLVWENGSETSLAWGAAANALGYHVYRGASIDLAKILDGRPDSCLAAATTSLATGNVLTTAPAAGDFDWYVVRAVGPTGEGPAGSSSSGAEVQDSLGFCP